MKYNFEPIISHEELRANQIKILKEEKEKKEKNIMTIIAIAGLILIIILLMALNNSDERIAKKTCNGKFEVITKMDGEKCYNCKGE